MLWVPQASIYCIQMAAEISVMDMLEPQNMKPKLSAWLDATGSGEVKKDVFFFK